MDVMYKIRNKQGKYSNGDAGYIKWTKNGKTWNSIGLLNVHLTAMFHRGYLEKKYQDCEIVKIEPSIVQIIDCKDAIDDLKMKMMYKKFGE